MLTRKTLPGSAGKEYCEKEGGATSKKEWKEVSTIIKNRIRHNIYFDKEIYARMQRAIEVQQVISLSEFVNEAVDFYTGYLNTDRAESYLITTFQAAITGTVGGAEERIARLLYKQCVEIAMLNRIIAYDKKIPEQLVERIREVSEDEVKSIVGYWDRFIS